jgi:hypothetical protein
MEPTESERLVLIGALDEGARKLGGMAHELRTKCRAWFEVGQGGGARPTNMGCDPRAHGSWNSTSLTRRHR